MEPLIADRLSQLLGRDVAAVRSIGGQHGVRHYRIELADGTPAFAKISDGNGAAGLPATGQVAASRAATAHAPVDQDPAGFAAEAAGLRWLAAAEAVPVPSVLGCDASCLIIEWVDARGPSPDAAHAFGRDLAGMHRAGSERFGAPWPGVIAGLELPNEPADSWPEWYVANRVLPYARLATDAGSLSGADATLIESAGARSLELADPRTPKPHPRRLLVRQPAVVRRPGLAD